MSEPMQILYFWQANHLWQHKHLSIHFHPFSVKSFFRFRPVAHIQTWHPGICECSHKESHIAGLLQTVCNCVQNCTCKSQRQWKFDIEVVHIGPVQLTHSWLSGPRILSRWCWPTSEHVVPHCKFHSCSCHNWPPGSSEPFLLGNLQPSCPPHKSAWS